MDNARPLSPWIPEAFTGYTGEMKTLLRILFLAAMILPLASCGGGEAESSDDVLKAITEGAAEASEASADVATEVATDLGTTVAEVVCCGGSCDAPAGFCHADGTCHGAHAELPIAP